MPEQAIVIELIKSNHSEVLRRLDEHNNLDERRFMDIGISVNALRVDVDEMARADAITKALNSEQIARAAAPMQLRNNIATAIIVGSIGGIYKVLDLVFTHWGAITKALGHP